MLSFSGSLKVFVAVEACDLRKGFNGLHGLVTERLGEDPRQGALFVFSNRRRTRIKILCWDGTGLWVLTNTHVAFVAEKPLPAPNHFPWHPACYGWRVEFKSTGCLFANGPISF
ncbi:MAG TPA: IS66 family insertion sequence element accessory protein TnpB [Verrucomicrobiae bacterium]|jgi:hypothetical protein|nr:IS66 family insertion sequence element accessory protein TnpB [Verrucomicrobiae bacterium]